MSRARQTAIALKEGADWFGGHESIEPVNQYADDFIFADGSVLRLSKNWKKAVVIEDGEVFANVDLTPNPIDRSKKREKIMDAILLIALAASFGAGGYFLLSMAILMDALGYLVG